jgi:hypothetical protein
MDFSDPNIVGTIICRWHTQEHKGFGVMGEIRVHPSGTQCCLKIATP